MPRLAAEHPAQTLYLLHKGARAEKKSEDFKTKFNADPTVCLGVHKTLKLEDWGVVEGRV